MAEPEPTVPSPSRRESELAAALKLRLGAKGAIREFLGVNDHLDPNGNIVSREPWSRSLRLYYWARLSLAAIHHPRWMRRQVALRLRRRLHRYPAGRPGTITMLVADAIIDRRVLLSARSLQQAGWAVTVIGMPYPGPIDHDRRMFPEVTIERINPAAPTRPPARVQGLLNRVDLWRQVFPGYLPFLELALLAPAEIYVAHDLPVLASAATAAEALDATLLYDAHELFPEQRLFGADYAALLARTECELIHRSTLVTTVNSSIAAEISRRYAIELPEVILNAPATPVGGLPVRRTNLIRERLGLGLETKILLFQGGLSVNRNLETLVRAMAQVEREEVMLVLMGPDGDLLGKLQRIAGDLDLHHRRVHFLEAVRQDVLLSWTASADVGIIPYPPIDLNSRLCTPNKLFEFIVAGLPILANDLPELRRFVAENGFGENHPMDDPAMMALAIDNFFCGDLQSYRAALQRRGAEFVWEVQGRRLVDLYRALPRGDWVSPNAAPAFAGYSKGSQSW